MTNMESFKHGELTRLGYRKVPNILGLYVRMQDSEMTIFDTLFDRWKTCDFSSWYLPENRFECDEETGEILCETVDFIRWQYEEALHLAADEDFIWRK